MAGPRAGRAAQQRSVREPPRQPLPCSFASQLGNKRPASAWVVPGPRGDAYVPPGSSEDTALQSDGGGRRQAMGGTSRAVQVRPPLRFVITPPGFLRKALRLSDGTFPSGRGAVQGLKPSVMTVTVTARRGSSQEDAATHQLFQLDDLLLLLVYLLVLHLQHLLQAPHVFFQVPIGSQRDLRGRGKGRSPGASSLGPAHRAPVPPAGSTQRERRSRPPVC